MLNDILWVYERMESRLGTYFSDKNTKEDNNNFRITTEYLYLRIFELFLPY
jgi:hypothetical protein